MFRYFLFWALRQLQLGAPATADWRMGLPPIEELERMYEGRVIAYSLGALLALIASVYVSWYLTLAFAHVLVGTGYFIEHYKPELDQRWTTIAIAWGLSLAVMLYNYGLKREKPELVYYWSLRWDIDLVFWLPQLTNALIFGALLFSVGIFLTF